MPKEKNSKTINQFRIISLLNVEGKIFMAVLSGYLVDKSYIDTSIQKAGIPGFSGCVEHTSVISQLNKEAKEGQKNFAAVWLALANTYGSVSHKLVESAMKLYHIPGNVQEIAEEYRSCSRLAIRPHPGRE